MKHQCNKQDPLRVGVLAFQGAFIEHVESLRAATEKLTSSSSSPKIEVVEVRNPDDLSALHGLILPGGESTTMGKFLDRRGFLSALDKWKNARPNPWIWGTCAGLILMADAVNDEKIGGQSKIGGVNITASRNSFGRQLESFESEITLKHEQLIDDGDILFNGIFIRAPGIESIDSADVTVLASLRTNDDERPVAVQQDRIMLTSFHPELTDDTRWHSYFLRCILMTYAESLKSEKPTQPNDILLL